MMLYVVGGDVLDAPYGHKVTFTPERTVGDACPYNALCYHTVGEGLAPPVSTLSELSHY